MRDRFKDSFNMNIMNSEINRKMDKDYSPQRSRKTEFLSKTASFLPLKLEHTKYIFPIPSTSFTFYDPEEYWLLNFWLR